MQRKGSHALKPGCEALEDRTLASAGGRGRIKEIPDILYTNIGGPQHLDLYLPKGPTPAGGYPAILALPGNDWRPAQRSDLGPTAIQLARDGYVVAVAGYDYTVEAVGASSWPENFQDVRDAVRWLRDNAGRYGIDPNRIAAWGEAAGGQLAALLGTYPDGAVDPEKLPSDPVGTPKGTSARVQAVVDFDGPTDLVTLALEAPSARTALGTMLGGPPDRFLGRYQAASPLLHISSDDPPFFVIQGTSDPSTPPDQSERLVEALLKAGVPVRFDLIPTTRRNSRIRLSKTLLPQILAFLDVALSHPGAGIASSGTVTPKP